MSLLYQRIRVQLETTVALDPRELYDYTTQARMQIGFGRALSFEVAVTKSKTVSADVADISTITLIVKNLTAGGVIDADDTSLLEKTVAVSNTLLTQSEWTNDSGTTPYHATFNFPASETSISMTGAVNNELTLGIVFTGLTSQGRITLASGYVTIVNDGAVITGGTPPVATRTMTDQEILALLSSKVGFTGNPAGSIISMPSAAGKEILLWSKDQLDGSATFMAESI